jgi:hypothetical protein
MSLSFLALAETLIAFEQNDISDGNKVCLPQRSYSVPFHHRNIISLELRHITTPVHSSLRKPIEVESIIAELQETNEGTGESINQN